MIQAHTEQEWVVRLQDGDNLMDAIRGLGVDSALLLLGIGMVRNAEIGYWDGTRYVTQHISDPQELISLQGNVAKDEDATVVVHAHVALGDATGTVRGGHLVQAIAHNTVELALRPLQKVALRRKQEASGLVGLYPELS